MTNDTPANANHWQITLPQPAQPVFARIDPQSLLQDYRARLARARKQRDRCPEHDHCSWHYHNGAYTELLGLIRLIELWDQTFNPTKSSERYDQSTETP